MDTKSVNLGKAFSSGWNIFTKHAGVLIGGSLTYIAMIFMLEMIFIIPMIHTTARMPQSTAPFSQMFGVQSGVFSIAIIFLLAPLFGGLSILLLNATRDNSPSINDLFSGYRNYWKWVGLYFLISMIAFIAEFIGILGFSIMSLGIAISLVVLMTAIMVRWLFIFFAAADGAGIIESFKKSAEMTKGIRLPLFGILIVLWLFATAGVIACGIGVILTSIIAALAITSIYVDLKSQMSGTAPSESALEPEPGQ